MTPTPRTNDIARGNHVVPTEWAEYLERESEQHKQVGNHWRSVAETAQAQNQIMLEALQYISCYSFDDAGDVAREALDKIKATYQQ
jgi:hypothetical protein